MKTLRSVVALACLALLPQTAVLAAGGSLQRQASWQAPDAELAAAMLRDALQQQGVEVQQRVDAAVEQFAAAIQQPDADWLQAFVTAAATASPAVDTVLRSAANSPTAVDPASLAKLKGPLQSSLQLHLGRQLVRGRLYDEALPLLQEIEPSATVDPAALLFHRAVCNHWLLNKDQALTDLRKLLENEADCPVRYERTARLMLADIQPLKEDSLDEISRLMNDVQRRLDLGRANEQVQTQEQTIIDKLTKLIDKIEEQQQQQQRQQQQQAGGAGGAQGGQEQPMQDSQAAGASGQGDVDSRDLGNRSGWGNLPPAERQEALQKLGQDLPTHYREAIEAYFRKLATDQ